MSAIATQMRPARFVGFLVLSATSPARFLGTEAVAAPCSELTESERRAFQRELLELRSNHEKTIHELQMQLDSRTAELESLRHEGCRCSQPATHRSIESSHDPTAPATAVLVHAPQKSAGTAPRLIGTTGRELLQSESAMRYCSSEELRTVLDASPQSRADAVKQLLLTNTLCGLCMASFASMPVPDLLYAVQSCLHQEENRCDASTGLPRIADLIPLASVDDRISIVRMVELVEACTSSRQPTAHRFFFACTLHLQTVGTACSRPSITFTAGRLYEHSFG